MTTVDALARRAGEKKKMTGNPQARKEAFVPFPPAFTTKHHPRHRRTWLTKKITVRDAKALAEK